ncbi:MAG: hypothetical protein HRU03_07535 [Nanoarchaeales archaeon]|nr:hypothetical protein [Nanoarchaeales archaeon]
MKETQSQEQAQNTVDNKRNTVVNSENIEHQKELNELENIEHNHKGGFEKNKHKPEPSDMRNLKNQNN